MHAPAYCTEQKHYALFCKKSAKINMNIKASTLKVAEF